MKGQHVRETEWQAHPSFAADALSRSLQHNSVAPQQLCWDGLPGGSQGRQGVCEQSRGTLASGPTGPGQPLGESWGLLGASPGSGVRARRRLGGCSLRRDICSLTLDVPKVPPHPGLLRSVPKGKHVLLIPGCPHWRPHWGPQPDILQNTQ